MKKARLLPIQSLALGALVVIFAPHAQAEPLRLRGDALVQTRSPSPVGLLVLRGEDQHRPWLDVETVTWLGVGTTPALTGDVLTLSVRMRDVASGSEFRAGRLLVSSGAVRPVHIDGVRGTARFFNATTLEVFGGVPVVRQFEYRAFDWAAGGRAAQRFGDRMSAGVSYLHRRSDGARSDEEAGVDLALYPAPWLTAAARGAYDLTQLGITDALASVSAQKQDARAELFVTHRSPGRMLPSTSLFSVLGDYAATSVGSTLRYRAFPRLELVGTGSGQTQGDTVGGQGAGRVTLGLDDDFVGTLGFETRRVYFGDARWTGTRAIAALPLGTRFRVGAEFELVMPDRPQGRGAVWPWALGALGCRLAKEWDVAAGVEASRGPSAEVVQAIARLTYQFEGRPR
jgi:hypothetical protein